MKFKDGVIHMDMSPFLIDQYVIVDRIHLEIVGREAICTSARDGEHMKGSKHYTGEAIDLRIHDMQPGNAKQVVKMMRKELGPDFDVVLEKNHIHWEYDPR